MIRRVALAYSFIGELARSDGDYPRARAAYGESLRLALMIGDPLRQAIVTANMGYMAQNPADALRLHQESVRIALGIDITIIVWGIAGIAGALADLGQLQRSARLMGAADTIMGSRGFGLFPSDLGPYEKSRAAVEGMLGKDNYRAIWEEGQSMSIDEMLAYALADPDETSE